MTLLSEPEDWLDDKTKIELLKSGWTEEKDLTGVTWVVTIKRDVVPDNKYMFSDPKFIGKSYVLDDTTLNVKRKKIGNAFETCESGPFVTMPATQEDVNDYEGTYILEFFSYETIGVTIGSTGALNRVEFK